ncbi:MAG: hypothetical protein HYX77_07230 [Acidobacteria bacterium]|nr:hypothetical protein [Acidobacteriota bacterium]
MTDPAIDIVRRRALRLDVNRDRAIELVGHATLVLIGEASHGTHEVHFFAARLPQQFDVAVSIDPTRAGTQCPPRAASET